MSSERTQPPDALPPRPSLNGGHTGHEGPAERMLSSRIVRRSRSRGEGRLGFVLLTALAALAFVGFVTLLAYGSDLVMPGVEVLGVPLGGSLRSRAAELLQQEWERMTIELQGGEDVPPITPAMLGMSLDHEATARSAYRQSRKVERVGAALRGRGRMSVRPVVRVDVAVAQDTLVFNEFILVT